MSAEENKALVRRFFEARVKTDLDALDKMLAPDFVSHTKVLPGQPPDREGYKRTIAEYSATFSNRRVSGRLGCSRTPSTPATSRGTSAPSESGANSTNHTPSR
jgi:ketosteroid isomerase-like protein